jgi:hypothetical protein
VFLKHPALRKAPVVLGLLAMLIYLPGCPLSPEGDDGGDEQVDTRPPDRNTVSGAVQLFAYCWREKRIDLYTDLLHTEFEYYPYSDDLEDFPWLNGDPSWPRSEELAIATNMFDPTFVSAETSESIDSISMEIQELSQSSTTWEGIPAVQVLTNMSAQVLWAENSGLASDVQLIFIVVPDPADASLWQIVRQDEQPGSG